MVRGGLADALQWKAEALLRAEHTAALASEVRHCVPGDLVESAAVVAEQVRTHLCRPTSSRSSNVFDLATSLNVREADGRFLDSFAVQGCVHHVAQVAEAATR